MKILILKSYGIGNLLMATPMIKALHSAGHEIVLLADSGPLGGPAKQLLEDWECLSEIREFDCNKEQSAAPTMIWFNEHKFDLVIQSFPADKLFDWLITMIKVPIRKALHIGAFWDKHEVDYNFDLVRDLIEKDPSSRYGLPVREFPHTDSFFNMHKKNMLSIGICPSYKREGMWWKKDWGAVNYSKLVSLMGEHNFFLIDSKDGVDSCNYIKYNNKGKNVINCSGMFNIQETCALINKMDLVIANDSGPAHIAAAYGKNLLVFFGPTSPVKNQPLSPNTLVLKVNTCPWIMPCQGTEYWNKCTTPVCLESLKPELVNNMINKYLLGV